MFIFVLQPLLGQDGHDQQPHAQVMLHLWYWFGRHNLTALQFLPICLPVPCMYILFHDFIIYTISTDVKTSGCHFGTFHFTSFISLECSTHSYYVITSFQALLGQDGHDQQPHGQVSRLALLIIHLVTLYSHASLYVSSVTYFGTLYLYRVICLF